MTAREDLIAAFVSAMQDGNWHMTADEDHAKATALVDAVIGEATSELQAKRQEEWDHASEMLADGVKSISYWERKVGRVLALHDRYRDVEAVGDDYSCAHCNQIAGHRTPWPCPTIEALETT